MKTTEDVAAAVRETVLPLLGPSNYVLFGVMYNSRVGDRAIHLGTKQLLDDAGIKLAGHSTHNVSRLATQVDRNTTILFAGGGNFGDLYPGEQLARERALRVFRDARFIQLPQTMNFRERAALKEAQRWYSDRDVTLLMRDHPSVEKAQRAFPEAKVLLCPDLAFLMGPQRRVAPTADIHWLTRHDPEEAWAEAPLYDGIARSDWAIMPKGDARRVIDDGLVQVGRGRVLITEKLHGHVLALLAGVPHVVLSDRYDKIGSFIDCWTHDNPLVHRATSPDEAVAIARSLL